MVVAMAALWHHGRDRHRRRCSGRCGGSRRGPVRELLRVLREGHLGRHRRRRATQRTASGRVVLIVECAALIVVADAALDAAVGCVLWHRRFWLFSSERGGGNN